MIDLHGKTLIFGDLHIGIKSDSLSRMMIDVHFIEYLLKYIKTHDIANIAFLGDWFNSREFINTISLSVGFELVSLIAKNVQNLVFIVGNHDLESNSYQNVSSVIGYDSIRNVHLVKDLEEGLVNGQSALFVPWGFANYQSSTKFKYIFGHFALPSSCIRYNKVMVGDLDTVSDAKLQINDIRSFCDNLDAGGIGFSGHIHCRTEQTYHQHRVIFVGSPFEMSFGETNATHGFYVLNDLGNVRFEETACPNIPRHIVLKLSDCFDETGKLRKTEAFKHLKGNIVKKIIDKDLTSSESLRLNEILSSQHVFEFAQAEYGALNNAIHTTADGAGVVGNQTETSALTLDSYFDTVIQAIDENTLQTASITKDELKECFLSYVGKVIEQNG